ncbi:carboxyl transferase domain-containing protein [Pseudooceanicola sp. MF1-13]|uniref:acetyl-CoA carboxylase family protein n=1 Tax=Pseudooceanicola sp. MF1-13 TaxID=3379095 RepID=UPI00389209BA
MVKLLIANRGEIAVRIARTAAEMGIETLAIAPQDDMGSLHVRRADDVALLPGRGARAYLDHDAVVQAGVDAGCDLVHPGYGFLSENSEFAAAVSQAGMTFVGPTPESLALLGDKLRARALAEELGVPVIRGSAAVGAKEAREFFDSLPKGAAMVLKAVAGGGGRGMRVVRDASDVAEAHARCTSEAAAAFGNGAIYAERFITRARHIEVQVLGDGQGGVITLGDRDCTLQRRHQKVIEIAPAPGLSSDLRAALADHARRMAETTQYRGLGTFEFLLDVDAEEAFFIEANPRIQVEHTVTEEIFGLDLVAAQLRIAEGARLTDLALSPAARGAAVQARVCLETVTADGTVQPSGGVIRAYDPPAGPGVRVDGFGIAGYRAGTAYDSLIAKVIASGPDLGSAFARLDRALAEFRIDGVASNIGWLRSLLAQDAVRALEVSTGYIGEVAAQLSERASEFIAKDGAGVEAEVDAPTATVADGDHALTAPMQATLTEWRVAVGDPVVAGQDVAILEAMKMEHVITADVSGVVSDLFAAPGDTIMEAAPLAAITPGDATGAAQVDDAQIDLDLIRPDLQEMLDRQALGRDEIRAEAVQKRHARGQRTARENIADLVDPGSFNEYGEFAVAAQLRRRTLADLEANTSGDGILTGTASINGGLFGPDKARAAVAIGDYTVLAGTQGQRHHRKLDRIFRLAGDHSIPMILYAEGGGGRPGDSDRSTVSGLDSPSFAAFADLSGKVPVVGVVAGRCFAGNAALLGCSDVIIATEDSNIGMAGPAMIEGGGLGVYRPEEVGPIDVQWANGVVDIRVKDEAEATEVAKKYLGYTQGDLTDWNSPDPRRLRHLIPENRLRVHEVRDVIDALADEGTVLELRRGWGPGMVTAFIRIEGRAYGVIGNNSKHLGGAIDADAADKAARFLQLCEAYGLPVVSLVDTPGFMVGPEAEKTALVRHVSRMFVVGASLSVPIFGVALRKAYGLGAMAMVGGGFKSAAMMVSWPTGEFGGMGLEGAVRLGYRKEIEAEPTEEAKQALFEEKVAEMYAQGKAVAYASATEIDAVIDPAETRQWIVNARNACPVAEKRERPFVDTW